MNAVEIGQEAVRTIDNRGPERDLPDGERSMRRAVQVFNAMRNQNLTEEDGWWFMVALKAARAMGGKFKLDDYVDGSAYVMLAGECAATGSSMLCLKQDQP